MNKITCVFTRFSSVFLLDIFRVKTLALENDHSKKLETGSMTLISALETVTRKNFSSGNWLENNFHIRVLSLLLDNWEKEHSKIIWTTLKLRTKKIEWNFTRKTIFFALEPQLEKRLFEFFRVQHFCGVSTYQHCRLELGSQITSDIKGWRNLCPPIVLGHSTSVYHLFSVFNIYR